MSKIKALLALFALALLASLCTFLLTTQSSSPRSQYYEQAAEPELLQFLQWMQKYNKSYATPEEFEFRYAVWRETRNQVEAHNSREQVSKKAMNHFADVTSEERGRLAGQQSVEIGPEIDSQPSYIFDENRHKNWVEEGAVTSVKSQGLCNAGYAFAAIGALQGLNYIHNKNLLTFSTQQIIDCTNEGATESCFYGYTDDAFNYLKAQSALLDSDYPYEAVQKKCTPNASLGVISIRAHQTVREYNIELQNAVDRQPIATYIDAGDLHTYDGGIIKASECGSSPTHGVLVVGYDTQDPEHPFWIIKNSWSGWWGEYGFARLELGPNTCGILNSMSYPEF